MVDRKISQLVEANALAGSEEAPIVQDGQTRRLAVGDRVATVAHGADATVARPNAPLVQWVGSVEPNNANTDDRLYRTDLDEDYRYDGASFVLIFSGTFSKRLYFHLVQSGGAVGQDPTADTAAWIAALKSGWPIWVPEGEFHINATFDSATDAPDITDWVIDGEGRSRSIIKWVGADGSKMMTLTQKQDPDASMPHGTDHGARINISNVGFRTDRTTGHTSQTYDTFTSTSTADAGTDGSSVCLEIRNTGFGANIENCDFYLWGTAVQTANIVFPMQISKCWFRFNNIAINLDDECTTTTIGPANTIERSAIGIRMRLAQVIEIVGNAIEGNYGGTDIFDYSWNKTIRISRNFFEASPYSYWHQGDSGGSFQTREVVFEGNFGLDVFLGDYIRRVRFDNNRIKQIENAYAFQDGMRDIVLGDNLDTSGDPFTSDGIVGSKSHQVIFEDRPVHLSSDTVEQITRRITTGDNPETLLTFEVPAELCGWNIEVQAIKGRFENGDMGTARMARAVFSVVRNGSGADVVLDYHSTLGYEQDTTTAGGTTDTNTMDWGISRTGAEASDQPQGVEITFNGRSAGGTAGTTIATVRVVGQSTVLPNEVA